MAAVVSAELRYRDGQSRNLSVQVDNSLSSLITGISELTANASVLLSKLVEQEKSLGGRAACGKGDESSEEDEEEDEDELRSDLLPPPKRSKT